MFTKLFASITESTIWDEDAETCKVWITMLAMADRYGQVMASIPGLANRSRVSIERVRSALQKFLQPDPESRTKDLEGRRVEEIDGGWRLVNHAKYRAIGNQDERRQYKAQKQKEYRLKAKSPRVDKRGQSCTDVDSRGPACTDVYRCVHKAEAEEESTSTCSPAESECVSQPLPTVDAIYRAYPKHVAPLRAKKAIVATLKRIAPQHDAAWLLDRVGLYAEKRRGQDKQYTPQPAAWFNSGSYDDEDLEPKESVPWEFCDDHTPVPGGKAL